jgi:predicted transcriptional regulator
VPRRDSRAVSSVLYFLYGFYTPAQGGVRLEARLDYQDYLVKVPREVLDILSRKALKPATIWVLVNMAEVTSSARPWSNEAIAEAAGVSKSTVIGSLHELRAAALIEAGPTDNDGTIYRHGPAWPQLGARGYVRIGWEVREMVSAETLSPVQGCVYRVARYYIRASGKGKRALSASFIAKAVGGSRSVAVAALDKLTDTGLLVERGYEHCGEGYAKVYGISSIGGVAAEQVVLEEDSAIKGWTLTLGALFKGMEDWCLVVSRHLPAPLPRSKRPNLRQQARLAARQAVIEETPQWLVDAGEIPF